LHTSIKGHIMYRLSVFLLLIFTSCTIDPEFYQPSHDGTGMRPIYGEIGIDLGKAPRQFDDLTNIVTYRELILAVEEAKGIHLIDNSNPLNPVNILFVELSGVQEMVVKEDVIIANTGNNLCSIDISDRSKAIFTAWTFIENTNSEGDNLYPPDYFGVFECADPDKGIIIGWEMAEIGDSDCWR